MRALLLLVLLGGCVVTDVDHDGVWRVSVFGDSNTDGTYPVTQAKWVQLLDARIPAAWHPYVHVYEHGHPSRKWTDAATMDVRAEIAAAIASDHPDAIVFALGSVDAWWVTYLTQTLAETEAGMDTVLANTATDAPGVPIVLASVPPQFDFPWASPAALAQVNALITARTDSAHRIDFSTGLVKDDTWDGLHFCGTTPDDFPHCPTGDHGQRLLADRAQYTLTH